MNIDEILSLDGSDKEVVSSILSNRVHGSFQHGLINDLIKWKDLAVYKALRQNSDLTTAIRNKIQEKANEAPED
jgi:hypothetical protein